MSTDLGVKLSDELAEDDWVHVVRQQMEQAPVSLGGKNMKDFDFEGLEIETPGLAYSVTTVVTLYRGK